MDAKEELTKFAYKTVCESRPECCEPRDIGMVAWDADDTLWEIKPYGIASNITGPFKVIDENTLEVTQYPKREAQPPKEKPPKEPKPSGFRRWPEKPPKEPWQMELEPRKLTPPLSPELRKIVEELYPGFRMVEPGKPAKVEFYPEEKPAERAPTRIILLPTVRETLDEIKKRGIPQTIISSNSPGSVKRIVDAFGLHDYFVDVMDTWENKGKVFDDLTAKHHVCPCNAIFVDNQLSHVESVSKKCALGLQIGKGGDIQKPIEVLKYVREK